MNGVIQQVWKLVLRRVGTPICSPKGIVSLSQNPVGIRPWNSINAFRSHAIAAAAFIFLFATFSRAQTSQFLFDANGNLQVQIAEVTGPPQILQQPQNQTVEGEAASFSVLATGGHPLNFQWRFNGQNIGSATNDALLLPNVSTNNEGEYRVVITNPSGSVTSAPAMLWMDSDGDGLGDSWELLYFSDLDSSPIQDSDGDGSSNLQEFENGTVPSDPNSVRFQLNVVKVGGSVIRTPDLPSYTNGQRITLTAIGSANAPFHAWLGDINTRSNPVTLVMTNNKALQARFSPISFVWAHLGNGDWNTDTNWTPRLAPGTNDIVYIYNGVTVTLNTPADCLDVFLEPGNGPPTLTGNGTLIVRRILVWSGGAMSGGGRTVIAPGATLSVPNSSPVSLTTRALENRGTMQWSGRGDFFMSSGALITNCPAALFDVQNAATFTANIGASRFDNTGIFRKSANPGPTSFGAGIVFNNFGAVEIQTGTLSLAGGGTSSGSFNALAGATLAFFSGTFALNSGAQLNGPGLYLVNSDVTASTNIVVENLDLFAGTLSGSKMVTILGQMNWSGGTMSGSGRTIILPGVTLNASIPGFASLTTRTLENGGTILISGTGLFGITGGAVLTNRSGALLKVDNESASGIGGASAAGRIDNAGIVRKAGGTGTTLVAGGLNFNNSGTVEIQTGTLSCNGIFDNHGAVNLSPGTTNRMAGGGSATGVFAAPPTTLVEWTGGSFTLKAGAQLNGGGLYRINGGVVVADANLVVDNLDLVLGSSALSGTGVVSIDGAMTWTAGTMEGSGRTTILPTATLTIANPNFLILNRHLENAGTVLWTGAGIGLLNGVITNRVGRLFHALNAATLAFSGGACRFDNAGTFRKSSNTGTTTFASGVSFNNSGTVEIRSGILAANGGYNSTSNALLNCVLGGTTPGTGHGQLQVAGTVTLNGALSVNLTNGFTPAFNDSFTVLTAVTRHGTFAGFSYPSNTVTMELSNTVNSVIARVTGGAVSRTMLLPPELFGSDIKLTWTATSNAIYRLEFNSGLTATNWIALPGDVTGVSNTASKLEALTPTNRFYRVRILP